MWPLIFRWFFLKAILRYSTASPIRVLNKETWTKQHSHIHQIIQNIPMHLSNSPKHAHFHGNQHPIHTTPQTLLHAWTTTSHKGQVVHTLLQAYPESRRSGACTDIEISQALPLQTMVWQKTAEIYCCILHLRFSLQSWDNSIASYRQIEVIFNIVRLGVCVRVWCCISGMLYVYVHVWGLLWGVVCMGYVLVPWACSCSCLMRVLVVMVVVMAMVVVRGSGNSYWSL